MFKPILFNSKMVQAIQNDGKTQTRRLMKPQPLFYTGRKYIFSDEEVPKKWEDCSDIKATYQYQPGNILWVRETWRPAKGTMHTYIHGEITESDDWHDGYEYRAGGYSFPDGFKESSDDFRLSEIRSGGSWNPSIFMPKEAARIFLRVKDVRIEKLQKITEKQAEQEGCRSGYWNITCGPFGNDDCPDEWTAIEEFKEVWESTVRPADRNKYGWDANPWVWVIEFEQIEKPEDWV